MHRQALHGSYIKVVCGFVEDEQVRAVKGDQPKQQSGFFAAGEELNFRIRFVVTEAKPCSRLPSLGLRCVRRMARTCS